MIKITNEIDGKLYELVKDKHICDACSFLTKDNDCILPKEQREFFGINVCGKLCGRWKGIKNKKQYEYGVESFYSGHWIIEQTGFDELCEAKDYIEIHKKNHPEYKFRTVRREIGEWEIVENEKAN